MRLSLLFNKAGVWARTFTIAIFTAIVGFTGNAFGQAVGDYRTAADGNWGTLGTWERWSGAAWVVPTGGQGYPGQNAVPAAVTILNSHDVTLNVSPANNLGTLVLSGGNETSSVTFAGTNSLTVNGAITIGAGTGNGDHKTVNVAGGTLSCASISLAATGGANRNSRILISTGTATVTGSITVADATGAITFSGAGILNVGNTLSSGATFTASTGTVVYNGAVQSCGIYTYNNLTLSGSGTKTFATTPTVNGVLSLEGTASVVVTGAAVVTYGPSATLQYNKPGNYTATVDEWITPFLATGGVVIMNTGDITLNNAKVFGANTNVPLNINAGAVLITSNNNLTFHGNFINDGTLTAGSSAVAITGTFTPQSIDGFTTTGTVSMTKTAGTATLQGNVNGAILTINGLGGTLNLGAGLTHTFSGVWNRNNGTLNGGSSTLRIGGNVAAATGTFTAGTGTVVYTGAAQTAAVVTYNNLTLAGSSVKTFATTPTVNGVLSMEGTATATVTTGVVTYGANATLQYNTATPRTASTEEWITPFLGTGGVIIANTGVITSPGALQMGNNTNVPLTIQSGASLTAAGLITLHGNFIRAGTFTSAIGITLAGTTATQSIDGFTTSGTVSMTKTAGVATFQGNVTGGNLTINGTGGTLNLGTGLTHNFTGTWTRTNGTLNGGSSTLRIGGNVSGTGGTFTGSTGTVEWNAAGAQTLAAVTYNNLVLSGSGNKTFTAATTISENLSISGTAIADLGAGLTHTAKTLTLGGASQPSGSHGSTGSIATYQNNSYFLNTSNGILNIACSATTSGTPTTYYSRNTTSGGNWNDNNSWTTSADGTGGPLAAGVWPRIFDNVVIRSGHTITIDAIDDNEFCGVTPDGLGRSNVGPFAASNVLMFYQTGDLLIAGTLSVTVEIMIENYTHVTSSGNFSSSTSLVNLGNLEVDNGATFSTLDDMILAGTSTTIVNTNSIAADDLIISFTSATLCGTGATTLQNGAGSVITYANGATVAQICSTYTVACTGIGCAGTFPVAGTTPVLLGNTGPGGVGNGTNNRLWLRADDLSLANGAAVDSWSDVSGNGLTATNATVAERPTFATNSANGFPSLSFDGTNDNLSLGAPAVLNFVPQTNSWSFIIAYRAPANGVATTPNQGTLFSKAWTGNRNYQYQIDDINVTTSTFGSYIGNTLNTGTVAINTNAWVISSHTNTTTTKTSFSNEASNFSGIAIAAGADAATDVLIGARRDSGPANGTEGFLFTGNIAEIMMYNSVLNTAQRIIIADYLAAKYAVTLSANDFYTMDDVGNGNFDSEVAGIGQASDGSNHKDAMGSGVVRMWNPSNLDNDEFLLWGHDNTTFYSSTTTGVGAPIQERLSRTWRVSESGGDVGTVSVSFDISLLATPLGSNLRLLIDRDNDGFADNDVTPVAGTFVDDVVVFSGVNFQDGDRFTLGNTDVTNPLPIELISFSAKLNNDIVELEWSTASELNNDFFMIERAIDLERFEEVVSIKGSGTTKEKHNYKTIDPTPLFGRSYYRLKQTDFDGKFAYSDLKVIDYEGPQFSTLRVYPNPNNGQSMTLEVIGLKDQSTVPVQIYNVQGQKVFDHTFEVNTPGTLTYDLEFGSPLRSGLYIIKAGQTLQLTQKIIVD